MNNLVAFVTGGASGLGRATARHLLSKGARACYVLDTQKIASDDKMDNLHGFQGDVSRPEDVEKALEDCVSKFGHVNAAINCAGVAIAFKIFNFNTNTPHDLTEFRKLLEVRS
jgi:3-hydroxyacyl-CoA dehydrogenase/3-hydroxy-2-methylbutyryl-CoA dehydrogenase